MKSNIYITKASGEKVYFEEGKLITSLEKAGASFSVIEQILEDIKKKTSYQYNNERNLYHSIQIPKNNKRCFCI